MKKYIILFIAFLFINSVKAQETPEQKKLLEKMSDEACTEMEKIDLDNTPQSELTTQVGFAILPSFEKHKDEIKKHFNLSTTAPADIRILSEKLGAVMILRCEKMLQVTKVMMQDKEFRQEVSTRVSTKKKTNELKGKVKKVEEGDFCYVYFTTDTDDIIKLTLLSKVSNETALGDILNGKSKKDLKVTYYTDDVYSTKDKTFKSLKVIASVEEL